MEVGPSMGLSRGSLQFQFLCALYGSLRRCQHVRWSLPVTVTDGLLGDPLCTSRRAEAEATKNEKATMRWTVGGGRWIVPLRGALARWLRRVDEGGDDDGWGAFSWLIAARSWIWVAMGCLRPILARGPLLKRSRSRSRALSRVTSISFNTSPTRQKKSFGTLGKFLELTQCGHWSKLPTEIPHFTSIVYIGRGI